MLRATTADGVAVAYHDLGGDGPPLLLGHATGFHGYALRPVAASLAGDFRVFIYDMRGHGDTPPPADGVFDWHGFARDTLAVVEAAGVERPFAAGHSAGAAALLLAELAVPATFRALYCYEPVVVPSAAAGSTGDNVLAAGARRRRDTFPSHDAAYDQYAAKPPLGSFHPDALRAYVDHGFTETGDGVELKCRPEHEARTYEMGMHHGAFERLHEITCPVHIACGGESDAFGPEVAALQVSRLRHGRAEVIDGLGHFGPMTHPGRIAGSIRRAFSDG